MITGIGAGFISFLKLLKDYNFYKINARYLWSCNPRKDFKWSFYIQVHSVSATTGAVNCLDYICTPDCPLYPFEPLDKGHNWQIRSRHFCMPWPVIFQLFLISRSRNRHRFRYSSKIWFRKIRDNRLESQKQWIDNYCVSCISTYSILPLEHSIAREYILIP